MKIRAIIKSNNIVTDVEPYYLYGRIVAYVGKLYANIYTVICDKYAYLPDELDFIEI
jgi:hypothetical protein